MNLALFDFDGTITYMDAFTKFVLYAINAINEISNEQITSLK